MQIKLSQIIAKLGGELIGEDILISGVASLESATAEHISFLSSDKFKRELDVSKAKAIIISPKDIALTSLNKIVTPNPYLYFGKLSELFNPPKVLPPLIHPSLIAGTNTTIGDNCAISSNVVIGNNCHIGENVQIYPNVVIGDEVIIGANTIIHANVTIYDKVNLGDSCVLASGCVIGSSGFGYAPDEQGQWNKIPQVGGVKIGNNVEIGANTTIDCGALDATIIEDGVKIDNLVQIAHNVIIGAHSAIAACVGIAGSTKIGNNCQLAGACSITGHVEIAPHTIIGGHSVVSKSITQAGLYIGMPAIAYKKFAKNTIMINKLEQMYNEIKQLKQQLNKEDFNG